MTIAEVLESTSEWPVDNVAAAAITPEGVETVGDTSRVFALASVSKLVTAYAVLLAAEEGAFDLDDAVPSSLLPSFDATPSYRELLTHA